MATAFGFYVPKYGLVYDGGLYASLGYSLQHDGSYTFNGAPGDVPPVYPVFLALSILLFGEKGIFIVTPFFSALFIITIFYILKREFDEDLAFLATLLVLFTPPLFFYAVQVVRDLPLMAFIMLSYLLYLGEERDAKTDVLLGIMVGLAFLTKYAASVYILPILIHALYNRRPLKIPFITVFVFVLPWMAWSNANHNTLFVSHSSYLASGFGMDLGMFITIILPLIVKWSFPLMLLFSLLGLALKAREEWLNPFVLLLLSTLVIAIFWPEKDIRYLLFVFVLIVYFALVVLSRFKKSSAIIFLVVALAFQGNSTFNLVGGNINNNLLFEDAGHWLRKNTPEDARVLAHSYRQVNYFSRRMTFQPPADVERIETFIDYYNISYAVVDTYERYTPAYMYTYLDKYRLEKVYRRESEEIMIYNLSRPSRITVLITFDFETPDGVKNIARILRVLKEHGVNATFFVTGAMARDFPEVLKEIKAHGHDIGSHGQNHEFPIFREKDAELFAEIFNKSREYGWNRSVKTVENFERMLKMSREEIRNATGSYPLSYRSPILTPSYTKDMRYLEVVERAGFTIDSSLSRRYLEDWMLEHQTGVVIVPASLSDSELEKKEFVKELAENHFSNDYPFVVFFHPWRFSKKGHFEAFEDFLNALELTYADIEYLSMEGYVAREKEKQIYKYKEKE